MKINFLNTISDSFKMSFYVAFSKYKFYEIIGIEGIETSQKTIYFLSKDLKERKKMNANEIGQLIIVLNNVTTWQIYKHLQVGLKH